MKKILMLVVIFVVPSLIHGEELYSLVYSVYLACLACLGIYPV
jgi:hypothetical protein